MTSYNLNRWTALDCAHQNENVEITKLLTAAGAVYKNLIMQEAAIVIQSTWRGYLSRKKFYNMLQDLMLCKSNYL